MRTLGFTLIELLITLTVISILFTVGLPDFYSQVKSSKVKTATQSLLESIYLTRTKAVSMNTRVTIARLTSWEKGWQVFIDTNNNGVLDNNEQIVRQQEEFTNVRIKPNKYINKFVSYIGTGESRNTNGTETTGAFQAGTFKICPEGSGPGYELILSRGGRVRKQEIDTQDCASI